MTAAVRVLGVFRPAELDPQAIESGLRPFLPSCCVLARVSVRIPQGIAPHPDNLQWHQDGGGPAGEVRHMIVWASEQPTELKAFDDESATGQPFEVVWFDNDRVWHRQPAGTDETRRWFAAVRCGGAHG